LKGGFATFSSPSFCLGSSQNASEYEPCGGGERQLGLGNTGEICKQEIMGVSKFWEFSNPSGG
jgi:hypothetical protein